MIKIGMIIGDRYEILEKIGTGGMSDVYKAKCHKLNRYVAVKVLKQEFSENANFVSKFRVEAQAAAGLMHPNIVNVYDVGEEDGIYYIVMELVEGITLKKYIEKKARLSVKEAVSIGIQIAMGLEAAHRNHIIHRDIKPQNVIISKEGKVKITDFGIAKAATSNTITSNVMGSVHYTSPEQARGGYSDERSDIYSLGITMFEMLTGRVPFNGETTVAIAIKHIQEKLPSPREYVPEIPVSVEKIVFKCCQKSPDRRYQTVSDLTGDLKQSLITPEEDFVKITNPDEEASTRLISDRERSEIKKQSVSGSTADMLRLKKDVELRYGQSKSDDYRNGYEEEYPDDGTEADSGDYPRDGYAAAGYRPQDYPSGDYGGDEYDNVEYSSGEDSQEEYSTGAYISEDYGRGEENYVSAAGGHYQEETVKSRNSGRERTSGKDRAGGKDRAAAKDKKTGKDKNGGKEKKEASKDKKESGRRQKEYEEEYYPESGRKGRGRRYEEEFAGDDMDDPYYEEEPEDDYDPKMEKITTVLAVIAAILIGCIVLFLAGRAFGLFHFDTDKGPVEQSTGPETQVKMIAVEGMDAEAARTALEQLGLKVEIEYRETAEFETGKVIEANVSSGTLVDVGSEVTLTAAGSSEGVEVPDVTNLSKAEAVSNLEKKGFTVENTESNDSTVVKGNVISQSPQGGTRAPSGSKVVLRISLGEENNKIKVPDVMGMTEMDAIATLTEAGITVGSVSEVNNEDPALQDRICYQSYSVGSYVEKDTPVDLKVSIGPTQPTYSYIGNIEAPTAEEDGEYRGGVEVSVIVVADDGTELLNRQTTSFPIAVNYTGIRSASGTITMQYTVTTDATTVTDPNTGEVTTTEGTSTAKTVTRVVQFAPEG